MSAEFTDFLQAGAADLIATAGSVCDILPAGPGAPLATGVPCVFTPATPDFALQFGGAVNSATANLTLRKQDLPAGLALQAGAHCVRVAAVRYHIRGISSSPLNPCLALLIAAN